MFKTVLMVFSLGLMGRAGRPALGYSKETARRKCAGERRDVIRGWRSSTTETAAVHVQKLGK